MSYCSACQLVPENPEIMMAADLESTGIIPAMVSTRRLEGTLVAPNAPQEVPDHLTETKLFRRPLSNRKLQVLPTTVQFEGFKVGPIHRRKLRIVNTSTINQPMHIIPPKTSFFSIRYSKKRNALIPGLSMTVTIEFKPKEWQYYYDCVRIHCREDQNILVPIHAYPVMNTSSFPQYVNFDPIPVGQSRTKSVTLRSDIPLDFAYELTYLQSHPAFTVENMKGVVPANGEVNINVEYSPTEFCTAVMELKLEISQYNSTFKTCTFYGTCTPGLALEKLGLPRGEPKSSLNKVPTIKPSASKIYGDMSRVHASQSRATNSTIPNDQPQEIVRDGYVFPPNLDTPSAVTKVLLQEAGKMKASQVKKVMSEVSALTCKESVMSAGVVTSGMVSGRQLKQAAFLQEVQQVADEERANHLRWVTRLGETPMESEAIKSVRQRKYEAMTAYRRLRQEIIPEEEYARKRTVLKVKRTIRKAGQFPDKSEYPPATFDLYLNNMWARRHRAMQRFVQAGRKVVVRLRCQKRLKNLQQVLADLLGGRTLRQSLADLYETKVSKPPIVSLLPSTSHHICPFSFPKYCGPPAPSCAGELDLNTYNKPVETSPMSAVDIKDDVPFKDLQVPQQSHLLGYSAVLYPHHGSYIPPGMPKQLLTGAKDEIENLSHIQGVDPMFLTPHAFTETSYGQNMLRETDSSQIVSSPSGTALTTTSSTISKQDSSVAATEPKKIPILAKSSTVLEDVNSEVPVLTTDVQDPGGDKALAAVVMPSSLCELPDPQPMQILNPSGGVTSYASLLPHSEATLDHVLLPLPPYSTAKYPRVRPDPSEVIPVLMNWKMFQSSWLISTESEKKLASVWQPSLTNTFSSDVVPPEQHSLTLLSGVQQDDYVDNESIETTQVPTMDMVSSLFTIPGDTRQHQPKKQQRGSPKQSSLGSREEPVVITVKPEAFELFEEAKSKVEHHRTNQFNQLGRRVSSKLQSFLKQLDDTSQS